MVSLMLVLTFLWLVVGPLHDSYAVFCFLLFIIVVFACAYSLCYDCPSSNKHAILAFSEAMVIVVAGYVSTLRLFLQNTFWAGYARRRVRQKLKNSRTAPMWRSLVVKVGRVLRRRDYACIL